MAVAKLKAGTSGLSVSNGGTGTVTISLVPGFTATFSSHTLVSGTAYAPSATHLAFVQCHVTHTGKVTWQVLNASTVTQVKYYTAATVIVGQSLFAMVPAGFKVKITLATSATVSALKIQTLP